MTARRLVAALLVAMTLGAPSAMASDVVDVDRTDASGPCVWVGRDGQRIGYCIR